MKCWGDNSRGQLGDGTEINRLTPVDVVGLGSGVVAVDTGFSHTCAVTAAGAVKCWGDNDDGQLGDGTTTNRSTPVNVVGLANGVQALSIAGGAGDNHSCVLTSTGVVKCWGSNFFGQLGSGDDGIYLTPVDVVGLGGPARAISAGEEHTCAVTVAGAAKCWGYNRHGALGNGASGSFDFSDVPVDVVGLGSGVATISAGDYHTCANTTGGAARCWGYNFDGQLGRGNFSGSTTPVDVVGLGSGVQAISAAGRHTCAKMAAGTAKCWGANSTGKLGDNTTIGRRTPVDVLSVPLPDPIFYGGFESP